MKDNRKKEAGSRQEAKNPVGQEMGTDDLKDKEIAEDTASSNETENAELQQITEQLEEKARKCEEYYNMLQRTAAEFDNYKKRTAKEKESIFTDASAELIGAFLPVVDNLERALSAPVPEGEDQSLREGVKMVYRQLQDILKNLGVEEIKGVGSKFDPNQHNAVMHVEDESVEENLIVDEFQKGYLLKDRVIRHSMVKVAN